MPTQNVYWVLRSIRPMHLPPSAVTSCKGFNILELTVPPSLCLTHQRRSPGTLLQSLPCQSVLLSDWRGASVWDSAPAPFVDWAGLLSHRQHWSNIPEDWVFYSWAVVCSSASGSTLYIMIRCTQQAKLEASLNLSVPATSISIFHSPFLFCRTDSCKHGGVSSCCHCTNSRWDDHLQRYVFPSPLSHARYNGFSFRTLTVTLYLLSFLKQAERHGDCSKMMWCEWQRILLVVFGCFF